MIYYIVLLSGVLLLLLSNNKWMKIIKSICPIDNNTIRNNYFLITPLKK